MAAHQIIGVPKLLVNKIFCNPYYNALMSLGSCVTGSCFGIGQFLNDVNWESCDWLLLRLAAGFQRRKADTYFTLSAWRGRKANEERDVREAKPIMYHICCHKKKIFFLLPLPL